MISGCLRLLIAVMAIAVVGLVLLILQPSLGVFFSVPSEFVLLVIGGIFLFSIVNALRTLLDSWVGTATRPNQPQTIKFETKETPSQIAWAAVGATFKLFIVFACLLCSLSSLLLLVFGAPVGASPPEFIRSLIDYLRSMF